MGVEEIFIAFVSGQLTPEGLKHLMYFVAAAVLFKKEAKKTRESNEARTTALTKVLEDHATRIENIEVHIFKK